MLAVISDMDPANAKAFKRLLDDDTILQHSLSLMFDPYHQTRGHHHASANYFLIRDGERFCFCFLFTLRTCGDRKLAAAVVAACSETALLGKDKHSMEHTMFAISEGVEKVVIAGGPLVHTLAPELHRPWKQPKENEKWHLKNARFLFQSRNGNLFVSCSTYLLRAQLSYPIAITLLAGKPNFSGEAKAFDALTPLKDVRFQDLGAAASVLDIPGHICMLVADSGSKSLVSCHVAFTSNSGSASVKAADSFASPVQLKSMPAGFAPVGVCALANRHFALSSSSSASIAVGTLLTTSMKNQSVGRSSRRLATRFSFSCKLLVTGNGLVKPICLIGASPSELYVADHGADAVLRIDVEKKQVISIVTGLG